MVWLPGVNCDCILRHPRHPDLPLIFSQIGFSAASVGAAAGIKHGPRIRVHYEIYWQDEKGQPPEPIEVRHLWLTVAVADRLLCPDGGWYPFSAEETRQRLSAILLEKRDIRLITRSGVISGLYGKDHVLIDSIYPDGNMLEIHLSTRVLTDLPLNPLNTWLDDSLTLSSVWDTAVWQ